MEIYSNIWTAIESVTFVLLITIFFMDSIRRWNFFGYRPTAVMGIFDPHLGRVLLAKVNGAWSFNQGGIYENNIYSMAKEILKRELGISETRFKLVYTKPLGSVRMKNKQLLTRARISSISIFPYLRGKGYLACFMRTNLQNIESEIKLGAGIQEVKIVSIPEARELIKSNSTEEHQPKKQALILSMLDEIEKFASGVKQWENESLHFDGTPTSKSPDQV